MKRRLSCCDEQKTCVGIVVHGVAASILQRCELASHDFERLGFTREGLIKREHQSVPWCLKRNPTERYVLLATLFVDSSIGSKNRAVREER